MVFEINLSSVLELYKAGKTIDIEYWKADGVYGKKKEVAKSVIERNSTSKLNSPKSIYKSEGSKLKLKNQDGTIFEIWTCLLVKVDGKIINHKN